MQTHLAHDKPLFYLSVTEISSVKVFPTILNQDIDATQANVLFLTFLLCRVQEDNWCYLAVGLLPVSPEKSNPS